ncbi:MAG: transcriptional repressor LexA [Clostridiales bacterium]|nr:transcriptional repressor LexA [Clostridiales bacterium]
MERKTEIKKLKSEDAVFKFIQEFISENGYAPCVREVCKACNIKSTATAFSVINRLKERGLLEKSDVKRRAISLKSKTVSVPIVGTVAAGQPIFANESYDGYVSLPDNFFSGEDLFILNVKGTSMIKIGIFDGDKVVVRKQDTADNGDIVVALVDDSATVKRFFKRDGRFILHPENDDMDDLIYDEVSILGKVVGLMRTM